MILQISIGMGLLLAWFIILIAPASKLAYEDRDLPEDKKRGVSILPGLPIMPIFVGIFAYFSNRYLSTWVAIGILGVNAALAVWALADIVYWARKLKKLSNQTVDRTSENGNRSP